MPGLTRKFPRPTRQLSRVLIALLLLAALAALALSVRFPFPEKKQTGEPPPRERRTLPDDVEGVMTRFSYSESEPELSVRISGKQVVRRGRRLLGLRSNLVKTNFIEELKGEVRSAKGITTFTAARAEWDAEASRPLLLQQGVSLTVCGKPLGRVQQAKIHLKSGVIEVSGAGQSYRMK